MKLLNFMVHGRGTRHTPSLALASLLLCVGAEAAGDSTALPGKDAVYLNTLPDGSIELSNSPEGDQSEQLAIEVPIAASQVPENPYRLRIPYGTTATAGEAAPQDLPSGSEPAVKDVGDSNGLANASGANPSTHGGYGGMNSNSSLGTPTSGANTGGLASAPPTTSGSGSSTASAPAASSPGSTTAASNVPDPISWQGSIAASAVTDPYLAARLPLIGSALLASGNAAIGRRYLMIDRNTYMSLYGTK